MLRWFACLVTLASPSLVSAQEVLPSIEEVVPIRVEWDVGNRSYYPLSAGDELSFDTPGPIRLEAEIRIRIPVDTLLEEPPRLQALGDGVNFMSIEASIQPATQGQIYDTYGGVPSVASRATLDVPSQGQVLSLRAPVDGPDFLVFLSRPPVAPANAEAALSPTESDSPWALPSGEALQVSDFDETTDEAPPNDGLSLSSSEANNDEPTRNDVLESEPTDLDATEPPIAELRPIQPIIDSFQQLHVGIKAGLGLPSWGTGMVPRLAARGAIPIGPEIGELAVALGWYRLALEDRDILVDPFIGAYEMNWSWRTQVVDLSAEFVANIPISIGPVQPIAGAGLNLYWARRSFEQETYSGLAPGMHMQVGGRYPLSVGTLEAAIGWNGGRRNFENHGQDGRPVRESLAATHLDVTWMMELP